jgi:hypothetical protein
MSRGFITTLVQRFPNSDDLLSGVRESVYTIPKDGLLHLSGSLRKYGNDEEYVECPEV